MKKLWLVLLSLCLCMALAACAAAPAAPAQGSAAPVEEPAAPAEEPAAPAEPAAEAAPAAFDMMAHVNDVFGGGHIAEGNTLKITRDITLDAPIYLANCEDVTIDLNGHILQYDAGDAGAGNDWGEWMMVFDGGKVRLGSSVGGANILGMTGGRMAGVLAMGGVTLNVDGIEFRVNTAGDPTQDGYGGYALYATDGAKVTIDGGFYYGDCGLLAEDSAGAGTALVINGGEFGTRYTLAGAYLRDIANVEINGGSFYGEWGGLYVKGDTVVNLNAGMINKIDDVDQAGWQPLLPEGKALQTDANGYLVVG